MKNPIIFLLFFVLACFLSLKVVAQKRGIEWQVGYFTPYLSNIGGTVACAFDLKELGEHKNTHRLQLLTQLGYFTHLNVSKNILLNPELQYKWNKTDRRFFLSSSLGLGYLHALQRQERTVNLSTGEATFQSDVFNYVLPNINIGLGIDPKSRFGFYLKATYGKNYGVGSPNAVFFALSTGLIFKFNSKD